jgi:ribosomal protein S18 acetylase RimI-like enzyme
MAPTIRWPLIRRDLPAVVGIECDATPNPWTESDFVAFLADRAHVGCVTEHNRQIVGHMLYELCEQHLVLHRIAVHPDHIRHGIGRSMVQHLVNRSAWQRWTHIDCIIPEDSQTVFFLRSCRFRCIRLLRDEFEGRDGYLMRRSIAAPAKHFEPPAANRITGVFDLIGGILKNLRQDAGVKGLDKPGK